MLELPFKPRPKKTLLDEVKSDFQSKLRGGVFCPVCDRHDRIYKRPLGGTACVRLLALYRLHKKSNELSFFHSSEIIKEIPLAETQGSGDFPKFKYHKMIEEKPNLKDDKKSSGLWRITKHGKDFVEGKVTVPKYMILYHDECTGFEGEPVDFKSRFPEKFNYAELMKG